MDHLAHTTLWHLSDCSIGMAVLAPASPGFRDAVKRMAIQDAYYVHDLGITLFSAGSIAVGQRLVAQHFGANCCSICLQMTSPCWYWIMRGFGHPHRDTRYGATVNPIMWIPGTTAEADRLLAEANNNALSQLSAGSANLRTALRDRRAAEVREEEFARRRRARTDLPALGLPRTSEAERILAIQLPEPSQAPTPAGTIRCTACHQVIPPGFEKAKDPKKTEDEIYAECKHEWDALRLTCKRCHLSYREPATVKLEID